ncbi:MAG: peptidoglycan-associated lipoprotein Pal [Thermoanaerobaculia bacterium]|nr:peptidoglycan-associated lipoprotein Pal [Thermoanaerobaculia bacterium]
MNKITRTLLVISLMSLLVVSFGCRSKTTTEEPPEPPIVEETPEPVVVEVEEPEDFEQEEVEVDDLSGSIAEVNARAHEQGWIRDAFFEFDEFTLTTESQDNLAISAAWLKGHPDFSLLIEGHADERGTEQYNLALGEKRANAAKDYLVALGVPASKIRTISYGEERPFATGSNPVAWAKNRRAHLVLEK